MKTLYICQSGDRVIGYHWRYGRTRLYRQYKSDIKNGNGMRLLTFKSKKGAQRVCDHTNEIYSDDFQVAELKLDN